MVKWMARIRIYLVLVLKYPAFSEDLPTEFERHRTKQRQSGQARVKRAIRRWPQFADTATVRRDGPTTYIDNLP
jgi:hypothetical protein